MGITTKGSLFLLDGVGGTELWLLECCWADCNSSPVFCWVKKHSVMGFHRAELIEIFNVNMSYISSNDGDERSSL